MNVDYFDEVCIRPDRPFGPEDVDELVRRCAAAGIDTICWRAIGLGVAGYPSRYLLAPQDLEASTMDLLMPRLDAKDRDAVPAAAEPPAGHFVADVARAEGYRQRMGRWGRRMAESLAVMDPLAASRDACRKHGLQWTIWHDYLDERHNLALARHPEWLVTGRDGTTRFPGLRSYAVPEASADQLQVIDELLAYQPDGLYLSTSCHNRHLAFPEPADFFGFEAPVVAACQQRLGVDIRSEPFDSEVWHAVKGDFYTDFFRQVKRRARRRGVKLAIGTQLGPHTIFTAPVFSTHVPYRFATQWQRWIDEEIADTLVLGDYEWPWDANLPIWEAKGMQWPTGTYAADTDWAPYAEHAAGRVALHWFSSWLSAYAEKHAGASADSLAGAMALRGRTLAATPVDGICLHEAMTFEVEVDGFDTIDILREPLERAAGLDRADRTER